MFKNIGSKIKTLAKFLFWLSVIGSIIGAVVVILLGAAHGGREIGIAILISVVIVIIGIVFAWLSTFMLYGFGELIDTNQKMLRIMQDQFRPKTTTTAQAAPAANVEQPKTESI